MKLSYLRKYENCKKSLNILLKQPWQRMCPAAQSLIPSSLYEKLNFFGSLIFVESIRVDEEAYFGESMLKIYVPLNSMLKHFINEKGEGVALESS